MKHETKGQGREKQKYKETTQGMVA